MNGPASCRVTSYGAGALAPDGSAGKEGSSREDPAQLGETFAHLLGKATQDDGGKTATSATPVAKSATPPGTAPDTLTRRPGYNRGQGQAAETDEVAQATQATATTETKAAYTQATETTENTQPDESGEGQEGEPQGTETPAAPATKPSGTPAVQASQTIAATQETRAAQASEVTRFTLAWMSKAQPAQPRRGRPLGAAGSQASAKPGQAAGSASTGALGGTTERGPSRGCESSEPQEGQAAEVAQQGGDRTGDQTDLPAAQPGGGGQAYQAYQPKGPPPNRWDGDAQSPPGNAGATVAGTGQPLRPVFSSQTGALTGAGSGNSDSPATQDAQASPDRVPAAARTDRTAADTRPLASSARTTRASAFTPAKSDQPPATNDRTPDYTPAKANQPASARPAPAGSARGTPIGSLAPTTSASAASSTPARTSSIPASTRQPASSASLTPASTSSPTGPGLTPASHVSGVAIPAGTQPASTAPSAPVPAATASQSDPTLPPPADESATDAASPRPLATPRSTNARAGSVPGPDQIQEATPQSTKTPGRPASPAVPNRATGAQDSPRVAYPPAQRATGPAGSAQPGSSPVPSPTANRQTTKGSQLRYAGTASPRNATPGADPAGGPAELSYARDQAGTTATTAQTTTTTTTSAENAGGRLAFAKDGSQAVPGSAHGGLAPTKGNSQAEPEGARLTVAKTEAPAVAPSEGGRSPLKESAAPAREVASHEADDPHTFLAQESDDRLPSSQASATASSNPGTQPLVGNDKSSPPALDLTSSPSPGQAQVPPLPQTVTSLPTTLAANAPAPTTAVLSALGAHAPATGSSPGSSLGTTSTPAASLSRQVAEDPELRVAVLPHAAHLSIAGKDGDLALHLRVRDGSTDVNVSGSMAPMFESKAPEMRAVLAGQGLHLGSFATDQQDGRQRQPEGRSEPDADAGPGSARLARTQVGSEASSTTSEGRIHVTA